MRKILLPDNSIGALFGPHDENIKYLESLFNVSIHLRGSNLIIDGEETSIVTVEKILLDFASIIRQGQNFSNGDLKAALKQIAEDAALSLHDFFPKAQIVTAGGRQVTPKSSNQRHYIEAIRRNDMVFAIGPGGTGKTYLAVAMAVAFLSDKTVS